MKYFILTLALVVISSFSAGHSQEDTLKVKDSVMPMARATTDKQVDSIFTNAPEPITFKDLKEGFGGIIQHIDSLNAAGIILMYQRDSIDEIRHRETIGKVNALDSIAKLQVKLSEAEAGAKYRDKAQNALIAFMGTFIGMVFFAGAVAGIRAARKEQGIIKSKDGKE